LWETLFQFLLLECSGFACFGGVLFCLFYPGNANKACKIAFPICYSLICIICCTEVIFSEDEYLSSISYPIKKLNIKDLNYIIIKIIDDKVYN
jgi:hypothetical protein